MCGMGSCSTDAKSLYHVISGHQKKRKGMDGPAKEFFHQARMDVGRRYCIFFGLNVFLPLVAEQAEVQ